MVFACLIALFDRWSSNSKKSASRIETAMDALIPADLSWFEQQKIRIAD